MLNANVTFRIIFGTCLFSRVTLWQRHLNPIYLASRKAQVTTCKHFDTHDGTQDNCGLQENGGANYDHFPIVVQLSHNFLMLPKV